MNVSRRLLGALACATALLVPAAAARRRRPASTSPISPTTATRTSPLPATCPASRSDAAQAWQDLQSSGAKLGPHVRAVEHPPGLDARDRDGEFRLFVEKANARGIKVLLTLTGDRGSMATPAEYANVAAALAPAHWPATASRTRSGTRRTSDDFWANGPQPGRLHGAAEGRLPRDQGRRPGRQGDRRRPRRQRLRVPRGLYAAGARAPSTASRVHTDTACLTTDPREYYREP